MLSLNNSSLVKITPSSTVSFPMSFFSEVKTSDISEISVVVLLKIYRIMSEYILPSDTISSAVKVHLFTPTLQFPCFSSNPSLDENTQTPIESELLNGFFSKVNTFRYS